MTAENLVLILGAFGSFLSILGVGGAWLLNRVDAKAKQSEEQEAEARRALAESMQAEMQIMRQEIATLRAEKGLYLRRIYQLELFIHRTPGIQIPEMEGWPPT